jgi:membrane protein DedA with SNARE-associated domain
MWRRCCTPEIGACRCPLLLFAAASVGGDVIAMTAYGFGGAALARRMQARVFRRGFGAFTGLLLIAAAILIALRG